jgi:SAM-dependent methyltransferase
MNILDFSVDVKRFEGTVTYQSTLQQLPVAGVYDLVYSHVVLEHVHDPIGFIQHAHRLLSEKGLFISTIDLTGHSYGEHPWSFLELSDEEFRARTTNTGEFVANRLRYDDYLRIFAENGFQIERVEVPMRMDVPDAIRQRWNNADLSVAMVLFACSKTPVAERIGPSGAPADLAFAGAARE